MIPTMELRFVEREVGELVTADTYRVRKVKVLQQKWVNEELRSDHNDYADWRDVPLVEEQT